MSFGCCFQKKFEPFSSYFSIFYLFLFKNGGKWDTLKSFSIQTKRTRLCYFDVF
jgi:hypothetical protein